MSEQHQIRVAFIPERVGVDWRDACALIGLRADDASPRSLKSLYERFRRWRTARSIEPDHAGLYSVRALQAAFEPDVIPARRTYHLPTPARKLAQPKESASCGHAVSHRRPSPAGVLAL